MAKYFLVRTICQLDYERFLVPPDHVCWARWVNSLDSEDRHVETSFAAARATWPSHDGLIWLEVGPECELLTPMEVLLLSQLPAPPPGFSDG